MDHDWRAVIRRGLACTLALLTPCVTGTARDRAHPPGADRGAAPLAGVMVEELEPIAPEELLAEDAKARQVPEPLRFAVPADVAITPQSYGTWEELDDGGRLWRLRIHAPGATDLNIGFTRFRLPPGAALYVVDEVSGYFRGPYIAADNRPDGELWTPVVPGSRAVLELYVPPVPAFEPDLELGRVGRGYRGLFRRPVVQAKQGSCNVDVACPEADGWRREIRSVAMYSVNGSKVCSGTMIMDATGLFRPLFLTAYHCGVTEGNDQTVVTYWNFSSPACGQLGGGSLDQALSGATLLARRRDADFCLLELASDPPSSYRVYWAGWDRRLDHVPAGGVAIHHPGTDEKAISFNDDRLAIRGNCIAPSPPDSHWEVDDWELGTTERGSSGGGLWDPLTHLLVGSLTGGLAACGNHLWDCFGRLAVAWDGPSPQERLRDWLDPQGTGAETVRGGSPGRASPVRGLPQPLPIFPFDEPPAAPPAGNRPGGGPSRR